MKNTPVKDVKKINWTKIGEKLLAALRFAIFTIVMLMGFWTIYVVLWNVLGFQCNTTAMWLLFVQALISELAFFKWFK